jgi:hypothetical protein
MFRDFLMTFYLWGLMQMYLQKVINQIRNFFYLLLASWKSLTKRARSGSWSLNQSPGPYQNVTNPEHCFVLLESALFPRKSASHFWFFKYLFYSRVFFMLDPDPNPILELNPKPKCILVPVLLSKRYLDLLPTPQLLWQVGALKTYFFIEECNPLRDLETKKKASSETGSTIFSI